VEYQFCPQAAADRYARMAATYAAWPLPRLRVASKVVAQLRPILAGFHLTSPFEPAPMPVAKSAAPFSLTRSDPIMGAFWVTFSMLTLTGLTVCAKALSMRGMHPFQVVFFRNLFAAIVLSPLLYYRGAALFETGQLKTYGWRCAVGLTSMLFWFYALSRVTIGEVTAITYMTPLFGTLGAILFLGETVRARRWTAMAVGFVGALIILRPGFSAITFGHVAALLSSVTGGFSAILVKQLTARDDPNKIVFLTHLFLVPMSLVPALFVWDWPALSMLPLLLGMGFFATLGHVTLVRGYSMMDASLALTFEFAKLPFAALVAWIFFNETVDRWTWVGAFVIIASATYITRREAKLRAEAAVRQRASLDRAA
jgi:drug/metabolite transporter (DMT)-like permease